MAAKTPFWSRASLDSPAPAEARGLSMRMRRPTNATSLPAYLGLAGGSMRREAEAVSPLTTEWVRPWLVGVASTRLLHQLRGGFDGSP